MDSPTSPPSRTPPPSPQEGGKSGEQMRPLNPGRIPVQPSRRFPRPPSLIPRFLHLCFRPEAWAETARYPSRVTISTLLFAILLGATIIAVAAVSEFTGSLKGLAAQLETGKYPAIALTSDGTLTTAGEFPHPIRLAFPGAAGRAGASFLIDPSGKSTPESLKPDGGLLITNTDAIFVAGQEEMGRRPLARILPELGLELPAKGQTQTLSGPAIRDYITANSGFFAASGIVIALLAAIVDALWAAMMLFFLTPIIMLAAAGPRLNHDAPDRRLLLPRRAATRMAAGLLVPLVLLDAILNAAGHPVWALLGGQGAVVFWFIAAGALAVWTGIMAKHMYGPKPRTR